MNYQLIALDMDGTALNSKKEMTAGTEQAIGRAIAAGKEVLFASGRCPTEMETYYKAFPGMHYVLCLSGALVLDLRTRRALTDVTIPRALAEQVLAEAEKLDAMVTIYAGPDVYVERRRRENLAHFNCQCFAALYDDCAVWVEELSQALEAAGDRIYKINLYCHDDEDRRKAAAFLSGLPLSFASGIPNNYEISPLGVSKGIGLEMLCREAGIPIDRAIAVGDEGNDLSMIEMAGLGIAMGNAIESVKAAADVITADCDHDGVARAIETYLL